MGGVTAVRGETATRFGGTKPLRWALARAPLGSGRLRRWGRTLGGWVRYRPDGVGLVWRVGGLAGNSEIRDGGGEILMIV